MRITEILLNNSKAKHEDLDFINTSMNDTRLFIDPVLVENGDSDFCIQAKIVLKDFFSELYDAYYLNPLRKKKQNLLCHAREINDTHLGYASKYGHGNTEMGLFEIFEGVDSYINSIRINHMYELKLCVPNFAEDGMSDLLTNILYKELSEFTIKQCQKYNIEVQDCCEERFYWDIVEHNWKKYKGKSLIVDGKPFVLVPKEIVQTHYRFTTDNYLRSVIVENICEETATIDSAKKKVRQPKNKVRERLLRENGTIFNTTRKFTVKNQNLLNQYYRVVTEKYNTLKLSDESLDNIIYKKTN